MKKSLFKVSWIALSLIILVFSFYALNSLQLESKVEVVSPHGGRCNGIEITEQTPNTTIPALVTSNHRLYSQECFEPILSKILKKTGKPFVLFISGRGTHPSKEIEKKNQLLSKIEDQYDVTAVMFTWPSWCGFRCFPYDKAHESGAVLLKLLRTLEHLKKKNKQNRTYTLLSHSMGSIVLQGLVDLTIDDLSKNLFDKIVVSAAASPQNDHSIWLNKLTFGTQLFITTNKNDDVLKCLENDIGIFSLSKIYCNKFKLTPRLGRWGTDIANIHNISKNALYFDFTKDLEGTHRYYINQMNESPEVFRFYSQVFQGNPIELTHYDEIISSRVYKLVK